MPDGSSNHGLPHNDVTVHRGPDWDVGRFDRWSRRYDRSVFQPLFFRRVHRGVSDALSPTPGDRVLDVGCGTGSLALALAVSSGALVTGVDPAPGMIDRAVAKAVTGRLRFLVSAAEGLPFEGGSFDSAVSAVSAHHWSEPERGFEELFRVLRPGGRLVIADVGSLGPVVAALRRARRIDPHHHQGWKPRELADLLYGAGFSQVEFRSERIMGGSVVTLRARR